MIVKFQHQMERLQRMTDQLRYFNIFAQYEQSDKAMAYTIHFETNGLVKVK